jgi:hypothetical protein
MGRAAESEAPAEVTGVDFGGTGSGEVRFGTGAPQHAQNFVESFTGFPHRAQTKGGTLDPAALADDLAKDACAAVAAAPQWAQNMAPTRRGCPQAAQVTEPAGAGSSWAGSGFPHEAQKRASGRFVLPQLAQAWGMTDPPGERTGMWMSATPEEGRGECTLQGNVSGRQGRRRSSGHESRASLRGDSPNKLQFLGSKPSSEGWPCF